MTPPCSRCHGFSEDPWPVPDNFSNPAPPLNGTSCLARDFWPPFDETLPSEENPPAWIQRSRYEIARQDYRRSLGETVPPFRIRVGRADLQLDLRPKNIERARFQIHAGNDTHLNSRLRIRCNHIPLQLQGLAEFTDTTVTTALGEITLRRLGVGDQGGVHLIYHPHEPIASALNLMTPYAVPQAPLGWDSTGNFLAYNNLGRCFTPAEIDEAVESCTVRPEHYQNLCAVPYVFDATQRQSGLRDFDLTARLPKEILEPNGRLPYEWDLETLLGKLLQTMGQNQTGTGKPFSLAPLKILASLLKPGSRATLNLEYLQDLFIPGRLDLGPSSAKLDVEYGSDGALWLNLAGMSLQGEAMDYPPIHLEEWKIQDGVPAENQWGETLAPGLRVRLDPETDRLDYEANLQIHFRIGLPGLETQEVQAQVLASGALEFSPIGLRIPPGQTHLELKGLQVFPQKDLLPLVESTNLILSDRNPASSVMGLMAGASPVAWPPAPLNLSLHGQTGSGHEFDWQGRIQMPLTVTGDYDLARLGTAAEISGNLRVQTAAGKNYLAGLQLHPTPLSMDVPTWELGLDLQREGKAGSEWLLREGNLILGWRGKGAETFGTTLEWRARELLLGSLKLQAVEGDLDLEVSRSNGTDLEIRLPRLRLKADASANSHGPLRGPLSLEQRPGSVFSLSWSPEARRLQVQDLDLKFDLQKLDVVPRKVRRGIHRRIRYLGMDGRLLGHFTLDLPEDWKKLRGHGRLLLKGDRQGDLYWLDRYGRRVGPPLVRETRWKFERLSRINWRREYALGRFHLDLILNPSSVFPQAQWGADKNSVTAYGLSGRPLRPFEIEALMPYDNQPWGLKGFQNRIWDYLDQLCRRDPGCSQAHSSRRDFK